MTGKLNPDRAIIRAVEWAPIRGMDLGYVRITTAATPADRPKPPKDPEALLLGANHQAPGLLFAANLQHRI
ncbi:hypothetical protein [Kribbella sp. CA-294648]|uniref:hypothetical protein n=1 Tax=Kribbella sp. CA-294648 TaxID=3239948 RepID=UPI003D8C0744